MSLEATYKRMRKELPKVCTGCGTGRSLTHSHIIRRSRRPDLIAEFKNISYHCRKCHRLWDSGDISNMQRVFDFWDRLAYIKNQDPPYFQILKNKMNERSNTKSW